MKNLTLSFLAILTSCQIAPVFSQELPCFSVESKWESLLKEQGQEPLVGFMTSLSPQASETRFYVNEETQEWTQMVFLRDGRVCVFAFGQGVVLTFTEGSGI